MTANEGSLRPVRWRGLPRGGTLLRVALVAALLGLAAAVLESPGECRPEATPGTSGAAPAAPGDRAGGNRAPATARDPVDGDRAPAGADGGRTGTGGALPLPIGSVGVPVRLAEPAALAVLRPGSRVDLLVVPEASAGPTLLASRALVLDVVGADPVDGPSALYLALPPEQARHAIGMPAGSRFAVVVRS
ncbi:flagellar biosynthesis protein FlgA [Micromonospora sp. R77]|uniref:flagellar biosynthesis protein FlgA n=1 Tax=Micromonospora sp. R77 TaxID=2925836 RepID=UPI001F61DC8A|nr:flagellar biosynthesis protein FlgA [Micromonospora sp. R77]MCI4064144.1 flagellar biosynthesis protein FlgA [Micromonospora sp. R77]